MTEETANARQRITDEQLQEMLPLIKDADSIELKLTIPASDQFSTAAALDFDPLDARLRQVFFFDTPELTLYQHGVVARARRTQQRNDDSTVKLRPVVPQELPDELRKLRAFVVELDAMPGGFVCSASYKGELEADDVRPAISGTKPLSKLFSKGQRAFFAAHAPNGIELDQLSILGPISVAKLNRVPEEFGRKLVGELWMYPDGSRIIELSTKCKPAEAFDVAVQARMYLASKGVDLSSEQQTKTRTALEYFAGLAADRSVPSTAETG